MREYPAPENHDGAVMSKSYRTVAEAVAHIGSVWPENGFTFQDGEGRERTRTFPEIERETARRAAGLQARGLRKGDRLGMVVFEPEDFVLTFLAALRVGVVPVPLYPPLSLGSLDSYAERTARILTTAGAKLLAVNARLQNILWQQVDRVPSLRGVITVEDLAQVEATPDYPDIAPDDLAFLQYTSGSTADPKGVMVSHRALVANGYGIMDGLMVDVTRDKGVTWLPLFHDMGLIGFVVAPILNGCPVVFIPTVRFIKRPSVWLETIHRHRGSITFAPNFAYALAARKARPDELDRWDLSCMRVFGCGAEPIHADTIRTFTDLFTARCKLPRTAFLPAYGLAEATLAVTFKPIDAEFHTRRVDAQRLQEEGVAVTPVNGALAAEHVSCGRPFPGHEIAILDTDGTPVPEGVQGEITLRGDSVTPGYFENAEATAEVFRDGRLHTGDLGFLWHGELYVTGRIKDLIILNGRNLHPQVIEWTVGEVPGVRKGNVVAFSRPGSETEELIVVLETRETDLEALRARVRKAVQHEHGIPTADIVCVAAGVLPKTSSGKVQRRRTREQYLARTLGRDGTRTVGTAARITLARHMARSFWTRAKAAATFAS
jgi:acyl-CoA synthetase (AMP-forming)/AMP-acid ligase II